MKIEELQDRPYQTSPTMVVRGDEVRIESTISLWDLSGSKESVADYILSLGDGLVDVTLEPDVNYEQEIIRVQGWRKMTEQELKKANRLREKTKKLKSDQKQKHEDYEREQLAKLKQKYEKS